MQQRGAAIIKARKLSSALSAASAACDHIRDWVLGTPKVQALPVKRSYILDLFINSIVNFFGSFIQGTWVSMGVYSDGSYGIQPGIIYSFPVTCEKGQWSIVQGKFHLFLFRCFMPDGCMIEKMAMGVQQLHYLDDCLLMFHFNGRAQGRRVLKGKDGCNSERAYGGEITGLLLP